MTPPGVPAGMVRCEGCVAWHHPNYHSQFRWSRRVRATVAWRATKRLVRQWWQVIS